jgi:hypothetical protein
MSGYSGLVNYFSDQSKQGQTFIINCDGAKIAEYPGTVFKTANASKSENNWVVTLPYTITLESVYPASGVSGLIESFEDSWNIEQLEEAYFFDYNRISPYYELGSNGTTINLDSPPSLTDLSASSASIGIRNILQYKISHRILYS